MRYVEQKDALHAARKPRPDAEAVTNHARRWLFAPAGARGHSAPRCRPDTE
jgi:hypothetical protein